MNRAYIKNPIVSEKATRLGADRKYVFLVADSAAAPEVRKAVQSIYNVHVENIHMINAKPKQRRLGRSQGVRSGYRKAIVTLKKGEKLDILPK